MTTTLAPNQAMVLGEYQDIQRAAQRIKIMTKGGNKLNDNEAMALAQISFVTGLNPYIGELWYIPGSGPMVGIAGARRLDNERVEKKGGYTWETYESIDPEEAGASPQQLQDVAAAFKCTVHDSNAIAQYQALLADTLKMLRDAGSKDPFGEAKEICGNRPEWVGYGFSLRSESSRMSKPQLARKRAHSDGLKKRIIIPFGAEVAETDAAPGYDVDAEAVEMEYPQPRREEKEILAELGDYDTDEAPIKQNSESHTAPHPDHTKNVDVLSADVVNTVINEGIFDKTQAATNVLARFEPKKAPLGTHLQKARDYRDWKAVLTNEGLKDKEATDAAIQKVNAGERPR